MTNPKVEIHITEECQKILDTDLKEKPANLQLFKFITEIVLPNVPPKRSGRFFVHIDPESQSFDLLMFDFEGSEPEFEWSAEMWPDFDLSGLHFFMTGGIREHTPPFYTFDGYELYPEWKLFE